MFRMKNMDDGKTDDNCDEWKKVKKGGCSVMKDRTTVTIFASGIISGMCITGLVLFTLAYTPQSPEDTLVRPQSLRDSLLGGPPVKPHKYWVETVSDVPGPRMYVIHNLVTEAEAKHLMFLGAKKGMDKALIIPYGEKHLTQSSTRTNSAAWLDFQQDDVVRKVEQAYADITGLPVANGENLQILHYGEGEQFKEHRDYFDPAEDPPENFVPGGNRIATFVLYLQNSVSGGETYFPRLGRKFKPNVGDALLFWDVTPDGQLDARTYHSATPVVGGEKWVATKWIHQGQYQGLEKHLEVKDSSESSSSAAARAAAKVAAKAADASANAAAQDGAESRRAAAAGRSLLAAGGEEPCPTHLQ